MNENVIKMARLMGGCKDRTCEDCLSQSKILFGTNKCTLIKYAEALDKADYRKQSEEEINKIIITAKRKLYDANLESVNRIVGEREKDIKQAWQNGYNKAREEVVKEFAEKVIDRVFEGITQRFCDCYNDGLSGEEPDKRLCENYLNAFNECKKIARKEIIKLAEQYGGEERNI